MHDNNNLGRSATSQTNALPHLPRSVRSNSAAQPALHEGGRVNTLPSMRPAYADLEEEARKAETTPQEPSAASVTEQLKVLEQAPVPTVFQLQRASGRMARIEVDEGHISPVVECCDGTLDWSARPGQTERDAAVAGITTLLVDAARRGARLQLSESPGRPYRPHWVSPAEVAFELSRRALPELDAAIGALRPLMDEHIGAFWLIQRKRALPPLQRIRGLNRQSNVSLQLLESLTIAADDVELSLAALTTTVVSGAEIATGVIGNAGWCVVMAGDRSLMGRFPLHHFGRVIRIGRRLQDAIAQ